MLKAILDHPATNPDDRYELNEGRKSTDENSVLHLAAYHGKTTAVHVFCRLFELKREHYVTTVDDQNSAADTALHVAAFTGNGTTASALLSHGADPALLNDKDQSPLHRAAKADQVACANALLQSSSSCESTTHGLLTLRDHKDQTPFFTAARHFNTNILSTLYDATIINEKDSEGDTALHAILTEIDTLDPKDYKSAEDIEFLIRQLKSAEQTIQFLCDNGALVDINNDSDLTAEQIVLESSYDSMDPAKNIFSFTCQIGEQPYQCQIYTTITSAAKRLRETNKVASTETSAQDQETFEQMMNAIANLTPQDPVDEEIITPVEHQTAQTENFFIDSNTETLIEEKTNMLAASAFEIQAEEKNRLVKSAIENQTDQEGNTLDKTTMEHITAEDERTLSEATATNQIIQEAIFPLELTIENQTEEEKTIAQLGSDNLIEEEVNKLVESAFSVESEDEDTSPAKSTSSETPGNTRASLRLSLDRLPMMPAQTASPLSPNMAHDSDLSRFVRLLEELSSLDDISDIDDLRTADGHNVLHLIASEPDFSHYEAVLIKHRGHKLFGTLLTLTTDNNLAPLHSIVLAHNVAMLDCILASNNPSLPELLCYTGEVRTKPSGSNVFHCIGNSHGNERAHQVKKIFTSHLDPSTYPRNYAASEKIGQSVYPMLSALVDLYGKEQSAYLAAQGDQDNCTLLTLACFTCNPDFVLACAEVCSYHDPEQKIVNSSAFFSAPTKSVDYSVYSLLSPMKLTGMTAPQILSLLGSAECLQILFKLNASATRIGCEKRCDFFDTESALDLACIAPCPSKAECLDFITVCSQISCSLGDSLNQFISNYSEAAQTVFEFIKMVDDFNMFDVTASTQVVIDSFNEQHSEDSNFTVS